MDLSLGLGKRHKDALLRMPDKWQFEKTIISREYSSKHVKLNKHLNDTFGFV
jgi:hypothetical protein